MNAIAEGLRTSTEERFQSQETPEGVKWKESHRAREKGGKTREFDTLKSKKVPQSLEIGLFFCQIFIFII